MSKKWMVATAFASLVLVGEPGYGQEPSRGSFGHSPAGRFGSGLLTPLMRDRPSFATGGVGHWVGRDPQRDPLPIITRSTSISGAIERLEIPNCRNNGVDTKAEDVDVIGKVLVAEPGARPPNNAA